MTAGGLRRFLARIWRQHPMDAGHEGDGEERRQHIQSGRRDKDGDEKSGDEEPNRMAAAQLFRFLQRTKARRGEKKIFATEQIGVGEQKGGGIDARHEQQHQREEIDDRRDDGKAQPHKNRLCRGNGAPASFRRIEIRFDVIGEIVKEQSRHQH